MDFERFDALTRKLGDAGTRRGLLRGTAASALSWLGLNRSRSHAVAQEATRAEIMFPVLPICTCPAGLVLCQGLCVHSQDCVQTSSQAAGVGTETSRSPQRCPPQEQFCRKKNACVPCPTAQFLDRDCRCRCRDAQVSDCRASCDCPKVAVCNCVCPGPPCASPKVQDANSCACVCPNTCSGGMVLDVECNCACPAGTQACGRQCVACPSGAKLDPKSCVCVCDTIVVPGDGKTVSSTLIPAKGAVYTIRVSGTFDISRGANRLADAEYVFDPNDNLQLNKCGAYGGDIGLTLDDPTRSRPIKTPATWGPYTKTHVYTASYTGTGNPIAFTYNDCNYRDNRGTLTVEILCNCAQTVCDPPKIRNGDGCECVCPGKPANSKFIDEATSCDWVCLHASCGDGCCNQEQVCNAAVDPPQCCAPLDSCPAGSCGTVPDNCGGTIDRGPCPERVCEIGVCNANGGCNGCAYARGPDNAPGTLCAGGGAFCCGGACCAAGQVCASGACCTPTGICPADGCGTVPNGCGGQTRCNCREGLRCCGASCINSASDSRNCGECGHVCAQGQVCQGGACVCPAGRTLCAGKCRACPPGGIVNPEFCDCVCDTILAPTNGATVSSKLTLVKGQQYTIRVSGTYVIGGGRLSDAEYVFAPNGDLQLNSCGAFNGDIGLTIDDSSLSKATKTPKSWGAYTKAHIYTTTYTGLGKPITFTYNDCNYADNRGTLTVEILCPTSRTGEPGDHSTGPTAPGGGNEPTSTLTPGSTGPTGSTATVTPTGGGVGDVSPVSPTETPTPTPPPISTPSPTPTAPPVCSDDELVCLDRCIPAADCPGDRCCFDPSTCTCTCPDCGQNTVFDPSDCACVCTVRECPPNFIFDETACTCTCVRAECPANLVFDEASCLCACVPFACPANFQFDAASCSCVCLPPACPANYQFDAMSCTCFCAEVACAEGEAFDAGSCACLPSGTTGDAEGTT